jgi:cytochrome c-type biogenesis protein CcmH/NrfG
VLLGMAQKKSGHVDLAEKAYRQAYGAQGHKQEEKETLRKALATNKPFPEMDDAKQVKEFREVERSR